MSDATHVSDALDRLRSSGGRVTHQRRLVLQALVDTQPHPSAEDVAEHVGAVAPEIHLSTVYRTLSTLTELGVISHVHLGHGRSVYHFAHDARPHLVCRACGRVDHVDADTFAAVRTLISASTGFELDRGHYAWSARCPECRDADDD
jgi:Fur family ferric uptake transcriptional regulator